MDTGPAAVVTREMDAVSSDDDDDDDDNEQR